MTDLLSGKGPGQRKEIFYFDDSGSLNAFRYGDWKVTFATKDSWWDDVAKPRTVPLVVNLRQDPYEMTPDSKMYTRWQADKLWVIVPAQAIVGRFLQTFQEFPPRQKSASVNVQRILDQMHQQSD
jgi:arylsulfatase